MAPTRTNYFFFYKKFFIKDEGAPEYTKSIQKEIQEKKTTHKDPTIAENPKHHNKNPKTLYNITS
jgi:hypothetical protein